MTFVYLIGRGSEQPPFKLGSTYDIGLRLSIFAAEVKEPLICFWKLESVDAGPLEQFIRRRLSHFPRFGEWTMAELPAIMAIIDQAVADWPDYLKTTAARRNRRYHINVISH